MMLTTILKLSIKRFLSLSKRKKPLEGKEREEIGKMPENERKNGFGALFVEKYIMAKCKLFVFASAS